MAIERFSSAEGVEIDPAATASELGRIVILGMNQGKVVMETMRPGEFDITPEVWTKNLYRHTLMVHEDGTGVYRAFPVDDEVGSVEPSSPEKGFIKGGRVINLPLDSDSFVVAGPKAGVARIHLFELVFYHPENRRPYPIQN